MSLELAAQHLAQRGRNGDSVLVHMTPSEVAGLDALARAHGGSITVNPETGLPEANFLKKILPAVAGAAISGVTGVNPFTASLLVGGATGLASGSLSKGLAAGLGAYGGASLMGGLSTLGAQALANQAAAAPYAANLPPGEVFSAAPAPTLTDKLGAGFNRLTQQGGPQAFVQAMGGAKPLMQAGLAGLAGASAFAPQRSVPTVTQPPSLIRPMVFQRQQAPTQQAQQTGRYFDDTLTPLQPYQAAEGGEVPSTGEPVQFMADGGQAQTLDMARLRGMQQPDALNYLRGITPAQANIVATPNPGEGGGMLYGDFRPIYAPVQSEGGGELTGFQRTITPTFDPTYTGGRYGDYAAYYDPQGALQDIRFQPQDRHGGFFNENLEWIGPLAVGGAALLGSGALAGLGNAGSGVSSGLGAAIDAELGFAAGAGASNAGLPGILSTAGNAVTNFVTNNPLTAAGLLAAATGAAGAEQQHPPPAGGGQTVPTATNPLVFAQPAGAPAPAGGTADGKTQSQIAYEYLMGQRPSSRAGLGELAGGATLLPPPPPAPRLRIPEGMTPEQGARWTQLTPQERPIYANAVQTYNQVFQDPALGNVDARVMRDYMQQHNLSVPEMARLMGTYDDTVRSYLGQADLTDQQLDIYQNIGNAGDQAQYAALAGAYNAPGDTAQDAEYMRQVMQQNNLSVADVARITGIEAPAVQAYLAQAAPPSQEAVNAALAQVISEGASRADIAHAAQLYGVTPAQLDAAYASMGMAEGGLAALARGGGVGHLGDYSDGGRLLRGPGDGVSDDIPATINGKRPARLADGEFVIPARIVSELGNGSTEAGARQLYAMMDRIQHRRRKTTGKKNVAVDSKASKLLPA